MTTFKEKNNSHLKELNNMSLPRVWFVCLALKFIFTTPLYIIKDITEVIRLSPLIKFARLLERPT